MFGCGWADLANLLQAQLDIRIPRKLWLMITELDIRIPRKLWLLSCLKSAARWARWAFFRNLLRVIFVLAALAYSTHLVYYVVKDGQDGQDGQLSKPFESKSYIFSTLAIFSWLTDSQLYYHLCHSFLLFYLYEFRKNCPFAHLTHLAPHFFVLHVLVRWSSNYDSYVILSFSFLYEFRKVAHLAHLPIWCLIFLS